MTKLQQYANECMADLTTLHVPFTRPASFSTHRSVKSYGRCGLRNGVYTITINEKLVRLGSEHAIKQTIMHELIHTIPGGMKHTGEWKQTAEYVSRKLGYHITRLTSAEELGVSIRKAKKVNYIIKCKDCGTTFSYTRRSTIVNMVAAGATATLTCGHCKSHHLVLI